MSDSPLPDDSPDTLVALVGSSPTPALLSALTFTPGHLVLVHSAHTARRAKRVAEVAKKLCPEIERIAPIEPFDLGKEVNDFQTVEGRLQDLMEKLGERPWRLCYTGGTKVMSVSAALCHLDRFPDRHEWRSYLDVTTDALWFTDGSRHPGGVAAGSLEIEKLAHLHDVTLRSLVERQQRQQNAWRRGELDKLPEDEQNEAWVYGLFRDRLPETREWDVQGNQVMKDPTKSKDNMGEFDLVVRYRHRVLCVEVKSNPNGILDAAGWTIAKARRAFGSATQVLFVHAGAPRQVSPQQLKDYNPDLNGAGVFVYSLEELKNDFRYERDLREAFFDPKKVKNPPQPSDLPAFTDTSTSPHPGDKDGPLLLMGVGGSHLAILAAVHAHAPSHTVLLRTKQSEGAGRGDSNLKQAVRRAMFAVEKPEEFGKWSQQLADGEYLRSLPRGDRKKLRGRADHEYGNHVNFEGTPEEAASVAGFAEQGSMKIEKYRPDGAPIIADITTGTKAMSFGLALAAQAYGGCVTYLSPFTRRLSCRTHGTLDSFGPAAVDWPLVLDGYEPLQGPLRDWVEPEIAAPRIDIEALELTAVKLCELTGSKPTTVWVDTTVRAGGTSEVSRPYWYSAHRRPTLIVTIADRAIGLAAPSWWRWRYSSSEERYEWKRISKGDWAHAVFAANEMLKTACGPVGRTLALYRPEDAEDVKRTKDLIKWLSWPTDEPDKSAHNQDGTAREITGHEESHRPKPLSCTPETPKFREELSKHLTNLGLPRVPEK
ncbi:PDDEXK family nuclease [Salinactinospora qingdaonensis]|uniref:CRISPR-associated protein n=1 Tax=Salinactinospora qingdaonensis TaxID=702744 RepID=A0ABP7FWE1_9ACTN